MRTFLLALTLLFCISGYSQYNFYFGNIHSHSSYSDGNMDEATSGLSTPADNFNYAKGSYHMDYLGISEHNHFQAGMKTKESYHAGVTQATAANQNGTFVCLYGMEWGVTTNSGDGHVVVYGLDSLVGWDQTSNFTVNDYDIYCAKSDYTSLWKIVRNHPGTFCSMAHPADNNEYGFLLTNAMDTNAQKVIVGCAIRNGLYNSTTTDYSDNVPPALYESYFRNMLAKGFYAAPALDADNHNSTFGRTSKMRTVILSSSLNRDSLLDGLRKRRFYASDDWNAQVTFTINGNYMGTDISTMQNSSIYININDADAGDNVASIQLYYGVPGSGKVATVLTSAANTSTLSYTHSTTTGQRFYYYAKITQADGDIIWTAPIWVERNSTVPVLLSGFTAFANVKNVTVNWATAQEINTRQFILEHSVDGINYTAIATIPAKGIGSQNAALYNYVDVNAVDGVNFYRIRIEDNNGDYKYSNVTAVNFSDPSAKIISVNPNPVISNLTIAILSKETGTVTCKVYNSEGRQVKSFDTYLVRGRNNIQSDVSNLAKGTYFLVLSKPDSRIAEAKFIKQ